MDPFRQLLDSTISFTQMTKERAEDIVSELVREGQVRTEEYQRAVQDLVDRSRDNAERFNEMVRAQVLKVLAELGIVTPSGSPTKAASSARKAAPAKRAAKASKATKKAAPAKKAAKASKKAAPAKKAASTTAKKATRSTKKASS